MESKKKHKGFDSFECSFALFVDSETLYIRF
jgi:hypothetical protein